MKLKRSRKMFEKILFATDFSDASADALESVKQLRDSGTREVVVLNVLKDKYFHLLDEYSNIDLEKVAEGSKNDALEKLEALARELASEGFKVKARLARGVPSSEILEMEQKEDVSLIVLGSHEKGFIKRIFLGSVSAAVTRKANHPVLVVTKDSHCIVSRQHKELVEIRLLPRSSYQTS
jgi:nucleotide-binding universal stress UspA family protein